MAAQDCKMYFCEGCENVFYFFHIKINIYFDKIRFGYRKFYNLNINFIKKDKKPCGRHTDDVSAPEPEFQSLCRIGPSWFSSTRSYLNRVHFFRLWGAPRIDRLLWSLSFPSIIRVKCNWTHHRLTEADWTLNTLTRPSGSHSNSELVLSDHHI